jgi:sugar lactone lactonase YvrE
MHPQPELIADYQCVTGEGPLWHAQERRLYWVDIPQGRMFRYDPATGQHEQCYQGRPIGGFTIQADGALLLFMDRGTVKRSRTSERPVSTTSSPILRAASSAVPCPPQTGWVVSTVWT